MISYHEYQSHHHQQQHQQRYEIYPAPFFMTFIVTGPGFVIIATNHPQPHPKHRHIMEVSFCRHLPLLLDVVLLHRPDMILPLLLQLLLPPPPQTLPRPLPL